MRIDQELMQWQGESRGDAIFEGRIEMKKRFIEMRAKGFSIRKIAKKLGKSPQTLSNWASELELEIARLKGLELEALFESFHLIKESRIKRLGAQLEAIKRELKKRDLSSVSTEKLLELNLKYIDEAAKEYKELKTISDDDLKKLSDGTGAKMDTEDVCGEMALVLFKYRKGLISNSEAQQELGLLQGILKAEDQAEIQKKIERLEALLERRS